MSNLLSHDLIDKSSRLLSDHFSPCFDHEEWVAIVHSEDVISHFAYSLDFRKIFIIAAMTTQVDSAFSSVVPGKLFERCTMDFDGHRFGFERIMGPWFLVYRINSHNQNHLSDGSVKIATLFDTIPDSDREDPLPYEPRHYSTEYALYKPSAYRKAQRHAVKTLETININWSRIWFRYHDQVVCRIEHKADQEQQEINGAFQSLIQMIYEAFAPFSGREATNLSLHGGGTTIWCDFWGNGTFWATEFQKNSTLKRRDARSLAVAGWGSVEPELLRFDQWLTGSK